MFQADVCLKALRKEGTSWNWQLGLVHAPVTAAAAADRLGSQRGAFSHLPEVTALLSGRVLHPGVAFKPMTLTITICHLRYRENSNPLWNTQWPLMVRVLDVKEMRAPKLSGATEDNWIEGGRAPAS